MTTNQVIRLIRTAAPLLRERGVRLCLRTRHSGAMSLPTELLPEGDLGSWLCEQGIQPSRVRTLSDLFWYLPEDVRTILEQPAPAATGEETPA